MEKTLRSFFKKVDEPMIRLCRYFFIHPNILTLARMALIPLIIYLYEQKEVPIFALAIFVLAWVLDLFDGPMARAHKIESELGAFLDPLADKALFLSLLSMFYMNDLIYTPIFISLFILETALVGIRVQKMWDLYINEVPNKTEIKANSFGKLKSIIEQSSIVFLLFNIQSSYFNFFINLLLLSAVIFSGMSLFKQFINQKKAPQ